MSKVLVTETYLNNIGAAIRSKNGTANRYTPSQMADAISAISSGSSPSWTGSGRMYYPNLVFPSGTTSIGSYGFHECTNITSVTIPNGVTSIGSYAFSGCTGITTITIPSTVTTISARAFSSCSGLTSITIPNGVTNIGTYTFQNCTSLTSVTIPNSVTSIGSGTFQGCSALKNVSLGNGFLASIELQYSTQFTADDIVAMFNKLGDVPSGETRTFTLEATNLAKLSDGMKLIATSRGWTLA